MKVSESFDLLSLLRTASCGSSFCLEKGESEDSREQINDSQLLNKEIDLLFDITSEFIVRCADIEPFEGFYNVV